MANIVLKAKRATNKELGHTRVYVNDSYIGYIIKNSSTLRAKEENWNFCSESNDYVFFYSRTKRDMIDTLTSMSSTIEDLSK